MICMIYGLLRTSQWRYRSNERLLRTSQWRYRSNEDDMCYMLMCYLSTNCTNCTKQHST